MPARPNRRLRFWVAIAACLAGIAVLCTLGSWQLERLVWKEALIASIEARRHAEPQSLGAVEKRYAASSDVEYVPMRVEGRFLHEGARYFLSTFQGNAGWNLYEPLQLADGRLLFVNRGFVPYALKDPALREEKASGPVSVTGLARNPTAERPDSAPDNDPVQNVYFWKSLPDMTTGLSLPAGATFLPFFLDAGPSPAADGYPMGGTTIIELPNSHLSYAITWFGLALTLAVMLVSFIVRSLRGPRPEGEEEAPVKG
ncbi:SURF1-like protein [Aureimonas sp. SA4125]|nr:SURF1-like protein [Aureimonas sp. SA4125]